MPAIRRLPPALFGLRLRWVLTLLLVLIPGSTAATASVTPHGWPRPRLATLVGELCGAWYCVARRRRRRVPGRHDPSSTASSDSYRLCRRRRRDRSEFARICRRPCQQGSKVG